MKFLSYILCWLGLHVNGLARKGNVELVGRKDHRHIRLKGFWLIKRCKHCQENFSTPDDFIGMGD